ncbi:MAG TPA: amidohydrolase family protein [Drouetiella sp.]
MINLSRIILIDHHAHSLVNDFSQLDAIGFRRAFSETSSLSMLQSDVQYHLHYMHMLHELSEYLDIEEDEEKILEMRSRLGKSDYVQMLFDDASIGGSIIDAGFRKDDSIRIESLNAVFERPVYQCLRIEALIEEIFERVDTFSDLCDELTKSLSQKNNPRTVALKTIAAYRGGLELSEVTHAAAKDNFDEQKQTVAKSKNKFRVFRSPMYHYLLARAFEVAGQQHFPVQIHTGLGDADANLLEANPWCFRGILENRKFASVNFVFLHCYPYVREAALLASLYKNVFIDVSLAINLVSAQAASIFSDAISVAPSTKILIATDGHSVPETYWYAAHSARRALSMVLSHLIGNGYIGEAQALLIAERLFHKNAQSLYRLSEFE